MWNTGISSLTYPKCPAQSMSLPLHVAHSAPFLSVVPMRGSRMPFGRGTRCGIWYRLRSKTWNTPHLPISVGDISENFTDRILRGASSSVKGVLLYSRGASCWLAPGCEPGRATGGHTTGASVGVAIVVLRVSQGSVARATDDSARLVPSAPRTRASTRPHPRRWPFRRRIPRVNSAKAAAAVVYRVPPRGASRSNPSPGGSDAAFRRRPRPPDGLVRGSLGFPQPARRRVLSAALP
jgi:hypothetical protein